ncbi:hypothetical protein MKC54_10905 [[Clostridium] innocuum]|nr:hypothetical protein [[Clostridium] innocuum]
MNKYYESIKQNIESYTNTGMLPCIMQEEDYWKILGKIEYAKELKLIPYEQRLELVEALETLAEDLPWYIKDHGRTTKEDKIVREHVKAIIEKAAAKGVKYLTWSYKDGYVYLEKEYQEADYESMHVFKSRIDRDIVIASPEKALDMLLHDFDLFEKGIFWEEVPASKRNV